MDARHTNLLKFIQDARQFVIPIYQRKYSWDLEQCGQLWKDILRAGRSEVGGGHFIGSIVYVADNDSHNSALLVIDGQQRLTTLSLLIAALAERVGDDEIYDGFSRNKVRGFYLVNPLESGDRQRKLVLSEDDRETLYAVIDGLDMPDHHSVRIKHNFEFFRARFEESKEDLAVICRGLSKLLVVYVALSRKEDNPQLIFESMNSTGRKLSQADLIRNFVLMGLEPDLQTRLYRTYWRPMEHGFGQEAYNEHFDAFMRHYLIVKTGEIPRLDDVYVAFRDFARTPAVEEAGVEALVKEVRESARHYVAMALGAETDPELKAAFQDLRELKVDVAYPFLLELYRDYEGGLLSHRDFVAALRLIEAFVFRRAISAIPTNSHNKTFATFSKALQKDRYLDSIKAHFLSMPSYRRFPDDVEFQREIQRRDLYNFRNRSYWLRRLENYGRRERAEVSDYTIEHIMPQSAPLPDFWQAELGDDWQRIHEAYLHTLGNLTLTGYNSQYSNRSFAKKRDMDGGFRSSPLRVNEGLGQVDRWTEDAMRARAERLAVIAIEVWPSPRLASDVAASFASPIREVVSYTINDHQHLLTSPARELFEAFRQEAISLDPCVKEEFLKRYVAYKAETNFVDVIPQARGLQLSINIEPGLLDDPRKLSRDVTGLGRWGNGDVEVLLVSQDDVPYVIGLVRQALEQQLGGA